MFVDNWLRHAEDADAWRDLSALVERDLRVSELAEGLDPEAYAEVETFETFDRALLRALVLRVGKEDADYAGLRELVGRRKPLFWFGRYEAYYAALEAASDFYELLDVYGDGFSDSAEDLFALYTRDLYRLDTAYRHYAFASDQASLTGDILKPLDERLEAAYTRRYLDGLSRAWSDALEGRGAWGMDGVAAQWQFYARTLHPYLANHEREKVFVIISDALRFEVAAELRERLLGSDLRGEAQLSPLLGVLPSRTNFGMAALLPGGKLGLTERGVVTRGGLSTQGTDARQKVLDAGEYGALAVGSSELLELSRKQARERVKEARIVYNLSRHYRQNGRERRAGRVRRVRAGARRPRGAYQARRKLAQRHEPVPGERPRFPVPAWRPESARQDRRAEQGQPVRIQALPRARQRRARPVGLARLRATLFGKRPEGLLAQRQ